jgi:serine/threonine protein kinase
MPPEVREHQPATTKSDLYSMGMSMCFLFEGAPPQVEGITDATKHFEVRGEGLSVSLPFFFNLMPRLCFLFLLLALPFFLNSLLGVNATFQTTTTFNLI